MIPQKRHHLALGGPLYVASLTEEEEKTWKTDPDCYRLEEAPWDHFQRQQLWGLQPNLTPVPNRSFPILNVAYFFCFCVCVLVSRFGC